MIVMETENLIAAHEFCTLHHIEISFIGSLQEAGLLQLVEHEEQKYIQHQQLSQLEKIIRLTHELDINIEGVEAIINLLERIDNMQAEMNRLRNKLRFYEDSTGV